MLRTCVLLLAIALPPGAGAATGLEHADALLSAGDFEGAKAALEAALDSDLSDDQVREIFQRLGMAELYLGKEAAAERAFRRLLLSDPDHELPAGTARKARELFARVKKRFKPVAITLELPEEHPAGRELVVPVRIENLPEGGRARLYYRRPSDDSFRWAALDAAGERSEATVEAALVERPGALDLYVEIVDKDQRRMAGEGSSLAPRRLRLSQGVPVEGVSPAPAPPQQEQAGDGWYRSPVAWLIGGGAVVGGGVLLYFALSSEPEGSLPVRVVVR